MTTLPPAGSIGLVRVRGLIGLLIRLGQWLNGDGSRNFEHAFVLTSAGADAASSYVVEARVDGTFEVPLAEYRGRRVLWLPCPPEHSVQVSAAACTYIGVDYSIEDYFAIATQRLRVPIRALTRREVDRSRKMICSQMATAAARQGGWEVVPPSLWAGYVTPAHLANLAPSGALPELVS